MAEEQIALTPEEAPAAESAPRPSPLVPGAGVLAVLALAWLAAMLLVSRGRIGRFSDGNDIALVSAALALPGVISAALVGGAAVGLAGVNLLAAWRGPGAADAADDADADADADADDAGCAPGPAGGRLNRPQPALSWPARLAAGAGAGLAMGLAMAVPIALGYHGLPSIVALAVTVGTISTIGGGLAALRPVGVIAAGVTGALGVFAVTLLFNNFSHDLSHLYGARDSAASRVTANNWLALTVSLVSGLVAGVLAYLYLRRQQTGAAAARWPVYLMAGALSGLLTALAELVTRLGGAGLLRAAMRVSEADDTYLSYLNMARVNRALVILFVGAITALVLFGRTLRPTERADTETEDADTEPADQAPAQPGDGGGGTD